MLTAFAATVDDRIRTRGPDHCRGIGISAPVRGLQVMLEHGQRFTIINSKGVVKRIIPVPNKHDTRITRQTSYSLTLAVPTKDIQKRESYSSDAMNKVIGKYQKELCMRSFPFIKAGRTH